MPGKDDFYRSIMGCGMRPSFIGIDEAAIFVPDYSAVEKRVLAWASPNDGKALIPPMVTPLEPALEPESASVVMLRALLDERRKLRDRAKASRDSRIAQAEDAERRAAELRKRAAADETTIARADGEIAAVLADIATLGGKPEPQEG